MCWLVGVLRSVVETLVPSMLGAGQHSPQRRRITCELIGDHHSRLGPGRHQYPPQERFGRVLITPLLHQYVEDDAVLVDGTPQPVALAVDLQLHLVQMPFVTRPCTSSTQSR